MRWVAAVWVLCAVPWAAWCEEGGLASPEVTFGGRFLARVEASSAQEYARDFSLSSARLSLNAKWQGFLRAQVEADIAEARPLKDAFLQLKPGAGFSLTAGRFKSPFSARRLESSWDLPLVERGLVSETASGAGFGGRRLGAQLGWEARSWGLKAQGGVFHGEAGERESLAGRLAWRAAGWLRAGASVFQRDLGRGAAAFGPDLRLSAAGLRLDLEGISLPGAAGQARGLGLTGLLTYRSWLGRDFWLEPLAGGERLSAGGIVSSNVVAGLNAGRGDAVRGQLQLVRGQLLAGGPVESRLMAQVGAKF